MIMTDRQFVIQKFPSALMDFKVRPINTMRSVSHYLIRNGFLGEVIGKGDTRTIAWRNAKKNIKLNGW